MDDEIGSIPAHDSRHWHSIEPGQILTGCPESTTHSRSVADWPTAPAADWPAEAKHKPWLIGGPSGHCHLAQQSQNAVSAYLKRYCLFMFRLCTTALLISSFQNGLPHALWTCWNWIFNSRKAHDTPRSTIQPQSLLYYPFNRQIIQFEFSPTWSCVSLTRCTTSSEWKLFRFDKIGVNSSQILLVDVTSLTCVKCGTKCANKKWKPEYMQHRRLKVKKSTWWIDWGGHHFIYIQYKYCRAKTNKQTTLTAIIFKCITPVFF